MSELELAQLRHEVEGVRLQLKAMERRMDENDERWKRIEAFLSGAKTEAVKDDDGLTKCLNGLTPRQHVLLQLFITGMAYEQMADRMGVSVNTIKTQAKSIRSKWGVSNRSDLIFRARKAMGSVNEETYLKLSGGIPKDWGDTYARSDKENDPYWNTYRPMRGANHEEIDE